MNERSLHSRLTARQSIPLPPPNYPRFHAELTASVTPETGLFVTCPQAFSTTPAWMNQGQVDDQVECAPASTDTFFGRQHLTAAKGYLRICSRRANSQPQTLWRRPRLTF